MYTIIVRLPENLITAIEPYRQKLDPLAEKIPPNITLVKPFSYAGSPTDLYDHLEEVGENQAPIKVSLAGWDVYTQKLHWLSLPLIAGRSEFIALREHLLSGPLNPLAGKDENAYRPHIIIGRCANQETLTKAKQLLAGFEAQFVFRATSMELLQRDSSDEAWHLEKRFGLEATVTGKQRRSNRPVT